jgi:hypothetical protein
MPLISGHPDNKPAEDYQPIYDDDNHLNYAGKIYNVPTILSVNWP